MIKTVKYLLFFLALAGILISGCSQPDLKSIPADNITVTPAAQSTPLIQPSPMPELKSSQPAKYLVLVVIDACRPDYFSIANTPNINALASAGISYSNAWVGQLRNDTPPGHTSIATGAFPRNDGILGFTWKDPTTQKQVRPTDWDPVVSGNMTRIISESGCTSIGGLYKKTYPGSKVAAISSDKFYAATGLGAESADFILFNAAQHLPDYARQGGVNLAPGGVAGHLAPPEVMNDPSLFGKKVNNYDGDTWAVDLALRLFNSVRPQVLLINLPQTDHSGHAKGGINDPTEMNAVVSNADKQIGRLMDAYKKAGIYDQTIFVITSDHAMTPTVFNVDMASIKKMLTKAGIAVETGGREIYLTDPARSAVAAEIIAKAGLKGINGVYYKNKAADGSYSYLLSSTTGKNTSGDLNKCYQYLTSTYASEKSADILLATADENWQKANIITGGAHGAATWTNQHIPLIISGPSIKKDTVSESPARIVDIAPTVLAAMGIKPDKMDGIVLADALVFPTGNQVIAQQNTTLELAPLEKALKTRSELDLQ